jgi:hypothetical protein
LGSPDIAPEAKIEAAAIINKGDKKECPEPGNNNRKRRQAVFVEETCPDGFEKFGSPGSSSCIHMSDSYMTYNDALLYCENQAGVAATLFEAEPNEDIAPLLKAIYDILSTGKLLTPYRIRLYF